MVTSRYGVLPKKTWILYLNLLCLNAEIVYCGTISDANMAVFCDVTLCNLVQRRRRFGGICCVYLHPRTLVLYHEDSNRKFIRTVAIIYQTARSHILKYLYFNIFQGPHILSTFYPILLMYFKCLSSYVNVIWMKGFVTLFEIGIWKLRGESWGAGKEDTPCVTNKVLWYQNSMAHKGGEKVFHIINGYTQMHEYHTWKYSAVTIT